MRERREHRRTIYTVNGVRYERLEDVPPEYRRLFEDADGNGVPDMLESDLGFFTATASSKTIESRVATFDGATPRREAMRHPRPGKTGGPDGPGRALGTISCARCGYDLTGSAIGSTCPECGLEVTTSIRALVRPEPSRTMRFIDALGRIGGAAQVLGPLTLIALLLIIWMLAR